MSGNKKGLGVFLLICLTLCLTLAPAARGEGSPGALSQEPLATSEAVYLDRETAQLLAAARPDVDGAIQAIRAGAVEREERVDISRYAIPISDFQSIVSYMYNRYAELFALENFRYTYSSSSKTVLSVELLYSMSAAEYKEAKTFYDAEMERITALVDPGWCRVEKILFLHDYLITHYEYDSTFRAHDAYKMLKEGVGVCQGYTLLMAGLLDRQAIPVSFVQSDNIEHIWNMVQLENGQWYHLDVTWGDPTNSAYQINHQHLLLSDALMEKDHVNGAKDWIYGIQALPGAQSDATLCADTTYDDYFWRKVNAPFVAVQGDFYFLTERAINRWTGEETSAVVANTKESCSYSGLDYYGGKLYYNTWTSLECYSFYTQETAQLLKKDLNVREQLIGCALKEADDGTLELSYEIYSFDSQRGRVETLTGIDPCHRTIMGGYGYYLGDKGLVLVPPETGKAVAVWYDALGRLTAVRFYSGGPAILTPGQAGTQCKLMGVKAGWTPFGAATQLSGDYQFPQKNS